MMTDSTFNPGMRDLEVERHEGELTEEEMLRVALDKINERVVSTMRRMKSGAEAARGVSHHIVINEGTRPVFYLEVRYAPPGTQPEFMVVTPG